MSMPAGVTATAIAAGADHSLAIGSDGNLYAWGYNGLDELGNGTTTDTHDPGPGGRSPRWPSPPTPSPRAPRPTTASPSPLPRRRPTTTTLSTSPSSVTYGQTVTITAALSRSDGGGTVGFSNGANTISGCGSVTPDAGRGHLAGAVLDLVRRRAPTRSPPPTPATRSTRPAPRTVLNLTVNQAPLVDHRLVGVDHLRRAARRPSPPSYSGFVNGDDADLAHHRPDVLDHGHVVEPGRELPELVLGCVGPELRHHLPERHGHGEHRSSDRHGLVGNDDLRRHGRRPSRRRTRAS